MLLYRNHNRFYAELLYFGWLYSCLADIKDAIGACACIISKIKSLNQSGVDAKSICVIARTHKLWNDYIEQLTQTGLKVEKIRARLIGRP